MLRHILGFIMLAGFCVSLGFEVSSDASFYGPGDRVLVEAVVFNDGDDHFVGTILSTLSSEAPFPEAVISHELAIDPGASVRIVLYDFVVSRDLLSSEYSVYSSVISEGMTAAQGYDHFHIQGTDIPLEIRLKPCADESCPKAQSVFLVGQQAVVVIDSEAAALSCSGTVSPPSGAPYAVSFPFKGVLDVEGTYRIDAVCSKEGHRDASASLLIGAVPALPQVRLIQECVEDGVCSEGETHINCPQDCLPAEAYLPGTDGTGYPDLMHIALGILLVAALAFAGRLLIRRGKKS